MPATAPPSSALATSYQPRPANTTPVERATSSASRLEVSYSAPPVQDMSCLGPAIKPSRDIATCKRIMLPLDRLRGEDSSVAGPAYTSLGDIPEHWHTGVFLDPTKTGLSSPRNRGDGPRSAAPSQHGYCVVAP